MKKIFLLLLLTACFSRPSIMTRESYESIDMGTTIAEVRQESGEPYAVYYLTNNREEYEYIERVNMGGRIIMENHYFLLVVDGQVIGKRSCVEQPPAYNILYEADPNYPSYRP